MKGAIDPDTHENLALRINDPQQRTSSGGERIVGRYKGTGTLEVETGRIKITAPFAAVSFQGRIKAAAAWEKPTPQPGSASHAKGCTCGGNCAHCTCAEEKRK